MEANQTTEISAQHTPGPWTYHFEEPSREWALVMSGGKAGQIVANVNTKSCPDRASAPAFSVMPAEANARLIAAAPELLAALEKIQVAFAFYSDDSKSELRETIARIQPIYRAAIAKAEGRA